MFIFVKAVVDGYFWSSRRASGGDRKVVDSIGLLGDVCSKILFYHEKLHVTAEFVRM
uniref:Uncharacterized protein n=1 Tax=Arundo donax TaxID=35708 RepID=A0A0A9EY90_ARUDO